VVSAATNAGNGVRMASATNAAASGPRHAPWQQRQASAHRMADATPRPRQVRPNRRRAARGSRRDRPCSRGVTFSGSARSRCDPKQRQSCASTTNRGQAFADHLVVFLDGSVRPPAIVPRGLARGPGG
jgi:hypothetical protein